MEIRPGHSVGRVLAVIFSSLLALPSVGFESAALILSGTVPRDWMYLLRQGKAEVLVCWSIVVCNASHMWVPSFFRQDRYSWEVHFHVGPSRPSCG